ncbi:MAG: hypothetical protein WC107_05975 [Patescibacteria group bacterium]
MKEAEFLSHELERQHQLSFQTSDSLDHKAEQAVVFIVVIVGYLLNLGTISFLRRPEGWVQFFYAFALLVMIVAFTLLVIAYRIQKVHIGSKQDYLLNTLKNKSSFLVPAVILGIKNSNEKIKQTNDKKALLIRWSHLFIIIGVSIIAVCEFILRSQNAK